MEFPSTGQPDLISLVICDLLIEDKQTSKKTLVGLFTRINVRSFPTQHSFWIYAVFTNMLKPEPINFRILDGNGADVLKLDLKPAEGLQFSERSLHEVAFKIEGMPLNAAGVYSVEFWTGDQDRIMGRREIEVAQV